MKKMDRFEEVTTMAESFMPSIAGFILGCLAVLAVEGILICFVTRRLSRRKKLPRKESLSRSHQQQAFDPWQSLPSSFHKQGVLWILDPEKVPKICTGTEPTKKSEISEVSPVRKNTKIHDRALILTEGDGALTQIVLRGCQVVAVSATCMPARKWAKRYPIKLESKTAVLYRGSKVLYIYAETSWEKESWCRALRLAAFDDIERVLWFSYLNEEFQSYLRSLIEGYPSLMKPSMGFHGGLLDKTNRPDDPRSKVRQFWKKISKKHPPSTNDKIKKSAISGKVSNEGVEVASICSSMSNSNLSKSSGYSSDNSDADSADKFPAVEGTLCWNLLVFRLFFDVKNNADIKSSLKARIQRTLSNMRTPSYIGEITCTDVDPGSLPPYIHGMRAVPADMDDLGALEMDVEYSGGLVLYIEARLDVGELDIPISMGGQNTESSSIVDETTDLLEDFSHLEGEFKSSDGAASSKDSKHSKHKRTSSGSGSRWKTMLNSVAKHVSQVPLSLTIRVAAVRGTIQLHIKPPPSDQLWFGFTSMPDINFKLESSVGDHKITNGRVAAFFVHRFKSSIRDTLVLPNCESAYLPFMLAEKDDWVPRNNAPFIFLNREAPSPSAPVTPIEASNNAPSSERKSGECDNQESSRGKQKTADFTKPPTHEGSHSKRPPRSVALNRSMSEGSALAFDVNNPLFQNEEAEGCIIQKEIPQSQSFSRFVSYREQLTTNEDDEQKPKKIGRKAKMLGLGKKMSEKFELKRRHIEERSKLMVGKMKEP